MKVIIFNGMRKVALMLLALRSDTVIAKMISGLTHLENQMMVAGTFVYSSLSSQQEIMLFNDYEITYSRKVRNDHNISDTWDE